MKAQGDSGIAAIFLFVLFSLPKRTKKLVAANKLS
jgi:hypothetical protein